MAASFAVDPCMGENCCTPKQAHREPREEPDGYLVWRTQEQRIDWFELANGDYRLLPADDAGVVRSRVFPGLRLALDALLNGDLAHASASSKWASTPTNTASSPPNWPPRRESRSSPPDLRSRQRLPGTRASRVFHPSVRCPYDRVETVRLENTPMASGESKTERIEVRTTPSVKALLQRVAAASHKNVTDFLLDAGINAAEDALANRRVVRLDEARWRAFQDVLDRPVSGKPRLARLLADKSVLE